MEWLNYHHLLYFWTVAREGGLAPAGRALRLSQSAISGQIRRLEQNLGLSLFAKRGRKLEMTESGRVVYRYAEKIFGLDESVNADAIEIYVYRLRKKLENTGIAIVTLRGLGYLLEAKAAE